VTPGVAAVLGGSPDAKTTEFGYACEYSSRSLEMSGSDVMPLQLPMCCLRRETRDLGFWSRGSTLRVAVSLSRQGKAQLWST
jgi:hypothetical protein